MSAGPARTVLATVDAAIAVEVLRELHRVCLMTEAELPDYCPRASGADYDAAMAAAAEVLRAYPLIERVAVA